jgi:hypothetical protein
MQKGSDVYNLNSPIFGVGTVAPKAAGAGDYNGKWETQPNAGPFNAHGATEAALMGKIVAARSSETTFNQELAGRYLAQNQASNAALLQLEIIVQSAVGSWAFKTTKFPYLRDRDDLWQKHIQNCCDGYCKAGRGKWQDRASCALLSCADFLLGLQTASGVVFPIVLTVKARFANRSAISSGLCFTNGQTKCKQVYDDIMVGEPVLVACFDQQILSIASSSAVISAQAFSQSTYASAVSQQG